MADSEESHEPIDGELADLELSDAELFRMVERGRDEVRKDPELSERSRENMVVEMDSIMARIAEELKNYKR